MVRPSASDRLARMQQEDEINAFLDIGDRLGTRVDGGEEILHVIANGGRDVLFDAGFGIVFRKFVELVGDIAMHRLALGRREIVAVDAGFERAPIATNVAPHGYFGSGGAPQLRCCQTSRRSSYSKIAVWVSGMLERPPRLTSNPPEEDTRFGQPRFSIQRVISSIGTPIPPIVPLPHSLN